MSARQLPATDAIAFQLAALLEQYEQSIDDLTSAGFDAALYGRVSRELGDMRLLCARLPLLSVAWVHLLISHAELMHDLWREAPGSAATPAAEHCRARHLLAIRALRQQCLAHFIRTEHTAGPAREQRLS